ncbi:TPA: VPA1269 family protein [Photobacterium damselae]|uniref:VPA1269 family protein n=1 Tax=Photobacterium damselae TaxID=38293 RepID=UPI003C6DE54E
MVKPDIVAKNSEEVLSILKNQSFIGNVISIPTPDAKGTVLINYSDEIKISNSTTEPLFDLIENKKLITLFKIEVVSLVVTNIVKQKRTFSILTKCFNPEINKLINSYANKQKGVRKKSFRGYLNSLPNKLLRTEVTCFINNLMELHYWADCFSTDLIRQIPAKYLPVMLLSSGTIHNTSVDTFLGKILGNVATLKCVKKKISDNIYMNKCDDRNCDDWIIFSENHFNNSKRRLNSAYRNIYLSVLTLGVSLKLWLLPYLKNNNYRLQNDFICSPILTETLHHLFTRDRKATVTPFWSRFCLSSSIGNTLNFPIYIKPIIDALVGDNNASKLGIEKTMQALCTGRNLNYPTDMYISIKRQQPKKIWYKRYAVIKDKLGMDIVLHIGSINSHTNYKELPFEWLDSLRRWHYIKSSSDEYKKGIFLFVKWAINRGFNSPWDVTRTDLIDPIFCNDHGETYFDHLNEHSDIYTKRTKVKNWALARDFYTQVTNSMKLENISVQNPFKDLQVVYFKGRKSRSKTPRPRISPIVINKMLEIIYSPDKYGKPTYSWAENVSWEALNNGRRRARSDHFSHKNNKGEVEYIFCPSRAAALTMLLLLPLRGVQVRWLDQGLCDAEIFNVETKDFNENKSHLKNFINEFGNSHEYINSTPTGVIQRPIDDHFKTTDNWCIYVNTNKTQLWEPDEKHGYQIPWPYFKKAKHSYQKLLNRPYEVLFKQIEFMNKYSTNQNPIRFDHVTEDRDRVDTKSDVLAVIPYFTPLFRDLNEIKSYSLKQAPTIAHPPISKVKLTTLFDELCKETEQRFSLENINIKLTKDDGTSIYDIHTLRVAGISNLIDIGVPLHIVSEYIAGHASLLMTINYEKSNSDWIRDKIVEAARGDLDTAMDRLINGYGKDYLINPVNKDDNVLKDKNIALFAPVEGGVCPLGGKGCNGCKVGMKDPNKKDRFKVVEGGCGNCRFWLTGPDFILEQVMEINKIMYLLKEGSRETNYLSECIEELEFDIEDAIEEKIKRKLSIKIATIEARKKSIEEDLIPLVAAWSHRYIAIVQSEKMLDDNFDDDNGNKVRLIGDENITTSLIKGTEFSLVQNIVEQAYLLPRGAAPIPENAARSFREFMDTITSNIDSTLLFARIKDKHIANIGAVKLANFISDELTDSEINSILNGDIKIISNSKLNRIKTAAYLVKQSINDRVMQIEKGGHSKMITSTELGDLLG